MIVGNGANNNGSQPFLACDPLTLMLLVGSWMSLLSLTAQKNIVVTNIVLLPQY